MSYILDALKKSEKMRKQGDVPDLQTVHMPVLEEERSNRGLYFIIVFLLISIAFLVGVYQPWKSTLKSVEKTLPDEISAVPKLIDKINEEPAITSPVVKIIKQKPAKIISKTKTLTVVKQKNEREISQQAIRQVPRLSELSPIVQQAIPNIIFAGHVYSSSAAQRSIIINGYAMSEGDVVVGDLKVKQITRDGVIFDYQGQLFREEILQDWSFD